MFCGQEHFSSLSSWSPTFSNFFLSEKLLSVWLPLVVMVAFSVMTLNVDGIHGDDKRAPIFEYLRSLMYDFYLLQETRVQTEDIEAWSAEWGGGGLAFGILVATSPGVLGYFVMFLLSLRILRSREISMVV